MSISARNLKLAVVEEFQPLNADFVSQLIDFKEMNVATIQAVLDSPDGTGTFTLEVSLICDPNSFITYQGSEKTPDGDCLSSGWEMRSFAWRYVRIRYVNGTNTTGTVTIYARGRRT